MKIRAIAALAILLAALFALQVDAVRISALNALRTLKYDWWSGTPLIQGVPRIPVDCSTIKGEPRFVFVAFGQSNSANYGSGRHTPRGNAYSFHAGRCFQLTDPLPGADGDGGSVWSRLVDIISQRHPSSSIVVVSLGVGSTSISRWRDPDDLFARVADTLQHINQSGLTPTHLLWHQGETDAGQGMTQTKYETSLNEMIAQIRRLGVNAPMLVAATSYCGGRESVAIRAAQRAVVAPARGIFAGPDTDRFRERQYRRDDCHFSAQGLQLVAQAWWQAIEDIER